MAESQLALLLFAIVCICLLIGFPVALTLAGTAIGFAVIGILTNSFDPSFIGALPTRIFGTMTNETLVAVPLFILMGVSMERAKIAEDLLKAMTALWGNRSGGLAFSVVLVGTLLAASTGIVGATVVTMGVLALPTMLRAGYNPEIASGTICATGTLGQIIPPSIALVLLGDVVSNAYQQAQLKQGIVNTDSVSVGDLFVGSLIPGVLLVAMYLIYLAIVTKTEPTKMPAINAAEIAQSQSILSAILPPVALIFLVLGSILVGAATPTEAAGVGATAALLLAYLRGSLNLPVLQDITLASMRTTSMVFLILIGATVFSLVFRGFGGDELIETFFKRLGGGPNRALLFVMLVMFLLGFILDFIEITFVVVPIVGPILLSMGFDPVWLGVMIAINLQTSFLTPPFGFALFYLRGVAPGEIPTSSIYRGVIPFILLQLGMLFLLWHQKWLATWLPSVLNQH